MLTTQRMLSVYDWSGSEARGPMGPKNKKVYFDQNFSLSSILFSFFFFGGRTFGLPLFRVNMRGKDVPCPRELCVIYGSQYAPRGPTATEEVVVLKVSHLFRLMGLGGAVGGVARDGTLSSRRKWKKKKNTEVVARWDKKGGSLIWERT